MTLNKDHLFVKLFYFSEWMKSEFHAGWWCHHTEPKHTNLCYFMRSILVYMPFMFFMQALGWILPIVALLICPLYLFGWDYWIGPSKVLGLIAVAVCVVVGVVIGFTELRDRLRDKERLKRNLRYERERSGVFVPPTKLEVVGEYVHAVHRGICPLIDIKDTKCDN